MDTDNGVSWLPQSRVGAVVAALLDRDEAAAEKAAEQERDDHELPVLNAAIRLAVRSLFDEDAEAEQIAAYVATMAGAVEIDQDVAVALIRTQLGEQDLLGGFEPQDVTDTTWSTLGYLCEQQLGRDESLELMAQAEAEALADTAGPADTPASAARPDETPGSAAGPADGLGSAEPADALGNIAWSVDTPGGTDGPASPTGDADWPADALGIAAEPAGAPGDAGGPATSPGTPERADHPTRAEVP